MKDETRARLEAQLKKELTKAILEIPMEYFNLEEVVSRTRNVILANPVLGSLFRVESDAQVRSVIRKMICEAMEE